VGGGADSETIHNLRFLFLKIMLKNNVKYYCNYQNAWYKKHKILL